MSKVQRNIFGCTQALHSEVSLQISNIKLPKTENFMYWNTWNENEFFIIIRIITDELYSSKQFKCVRTKD